MCHICHTVPLQRGLQGVLFSVSAIAECVVVSSSTGDGSQEKPRSLRGYHCIKDCFSHHPVSLVSTVNVLRFPVFNVGTYLRITNQKEGTSTRIDLLSAHSLLSQGWRWESRPGMGLTSLSSPR